jgi:Tol biopolymer transport system component
MQFEITDEAAITLAHEFYGAIADGYPVDASLAEARKAVFARNNDVEWGTPVLYMRSRDGRIFELDRSTRQEPTPIPAEPQVYSSISAVDLPVIIPAAEAVRGTQTKATLPPATSRAEPGMVESGHTHGRGDAHPETHRHSRAPWVVGVLALIVLVGAALVITGVIDPRALLSPGSLNQGDGSSLVAAVENPQLTAGIPAGGVGFTDTPPPSPTEASSELTVTEDPDSVIVVAPPVESATDTPTNEPSPTDAPTDTPTIGPTPVGGGPGQIAFASDRSGTPQIWLVDVDGNNPIQITNRQDGACQPAWSPDGLQLVFVSPCEKNQDRYLNSALYLINADGSGEQQLTAGIGGDYDPSWAPNSLIVFASDRENFTSIYVIDPAAGGEPVALTRNSNNYQPDWSPDGKQIAFSSTRLGVAKIFTMPDLGEIAEGGHQAREFSRGSEFAYSIPRYSPDGEALIFLKSINPPDKNVLPELAGSNIADLGLKEFYVATSDKVGTIREADYSPDGNWVVFVSWPGLNYDIYIMTANGSDQRQVTSDPAIDFDPAWRPIVQP